MKKLLLLCAVFAFVGTSTINAQCTKSKTACTKSKTACTKSKTATATAATLKTADAPETVTIKETKVCPTSGKTYVTERTVVKTASVAAQKDCGDNCDKDCCKGKKAAAVKTGTTTKAACTKSKTQCTKAQKAACTKSAEAKSTSLNAAPAKTCTKAQKAACTKSAEAKSTSLNAAPAKTCTKSKTACTKSAAKSTSLTNAAPAKTCTKSKTACTKSKTTTTTTTNEVKPTVVKLENNQ